MLTFEEWNTLPRYRRNALIGSIVMGLITRFDVLAEAAYSWCELPDTGHGGHWLTTPDYVCDDRWAVAVQAQVLGPLRVGWRRYREVLLSLHKAQSVKLFKWSILLDANTRCYAAYAVVISAHTTPEPEVSLAE